MCQFRCQQPESPGANKPHKPVHSIQQPDNHSTFLTWTERTGNGTGTWDTEKWCVRFLLEEATVTPVLTVWPEPGLEVTWTLRLMLPVKNAIS